MTAIIASEIWSELKSYVQTGDHSHAAEMIINILIDHDCDIDEIKAAFKGDSDIKHAITAYLDEFGKDDGDDGDDGNDDDKDEEEDWEN